MPTTTTTTSTTTITTPPTETETETANAKAAPALRLTRKGRKLELETKKTKPTWWLKIEKAKKKKQAQRKREAQRKAKAARDTPKKVTKTNKGEGSGGASGQPAIILQKEKMIARKKTLKTIDIIDLTDGDKDEGRLSLLGHGDKTNGPETHVINRAISVWVPSVDPTGEDEAFGRVIFQRQTLEIPFTNHSYLFSDLAEWLASCGMPQDEPPASVSFCITISKSKFASLAVQQQRALWRQGSIHIYEDSPKLTLMSSLEILKDLGANILQTRSIYEKQRAKCSEEPMTGLRYDSLLSLFSSSSVDMLDCNVLDIPLPSTQGYLPPRCLRNLSLNNELCSMPAPIGVPHDSLQWCLFATPPSQTDVHIDAGKFHTWIQPQNGMKLWMVQEPLREVEEVNTLGMDDKVGKWYGMVLSPGDVLIMPANTNHRVVTLKESVTMGGHFYSIDNLERMMLAGLQENLWGDATNTAHPQSEGMVYRLAGFLESVLGQVNRKGGLFTDDERERFSVPAELETKVFPPLIFMLMYPERLVPQFKADGNIDSSPLSSDMKKLREPSRNLVYRLLKLKPHLNDQVSKLRSIKLLGQLKK